MFKVNTEFEFEYESLILDYSGICQVIPRKASGQRGGESHSPCTLYTSFVDFEKKRLGAL